MPSKMASFLVFIDSPFFPKINGALNHPPFNFTLHRGPYPGAFGPSSITDRRRMLCWTLKGA